jgi:hypothetical protein
MQELMSRHKTTTFSPRDCLKTILHQRWSKTCSGKRKNVVFLYKFCNFQMRDQLPKHDENEKLIYQQLKILISIIAQHRQKNVHRVILFTLNHQHKE